MGGANPEQVVLVCILKKSRMSKPVNSIPPWLQLQLLPVVLPRRPSMTDCNVELKGEINSFFAKELSVMVFIITTETLTLTNELNDKKNNSAEKKK